MANVSIRNYFKSLYFLLILLNFCSPPRELEAPGKETKPNPKPEHAKPIPIQKPLENVGISKSPLISNGQELAGVVPLLESSGPGSDNKMPQTWQSYGLQATAAVCLLSGAAFFATHSWLYLRGKL